MRAAASVGFQVSPAEHADHFSATRELGRQMGAHVAMNRRSSAPFVDLRLEDGDTLIVGKLPG
jgi:hypothetical protein